MAFCNSCGTTLAPGAQFCNKCGAAVVGAAAPSASVPPPRSSGVKVLLIVVGAIAGIIILCVAMVSIIGYKIARNTHVNQQGDRVKVETPFGTFSANDPEQAAKDLGVEMYPGAEVQKNGSATATFGNVHTVNAVFLSGDPVDKVCDFYKLKFPAAAVKSSDQKHCNIVSSNGENSITINIESTGDGSKIQIASVNKQASK